MISTFEARNGELPHLGSLSADRDRAGRSDRVVAARPALVVNLGRDPSHHGRTLSARDKIEERRINRGEHERDTDCLPDAW